MKIQYENKRDISPHWSITGKVMIRLSTIASSLRNIATSQDVQIKLSFHLSPSPTSKPRISISPQIPNPTSKTPMPHVYQPSKAHRPFFSLASIFYVSLRNIRKRARGIHNATSLTMTARVLNHLLYPLIPHTLPPDQSNSLTESPQQPQ